MRNLKLKGLKYEKGKYDLYKERFVFFPPQIIDILSSIYGEGVKALLVWLGKKVGWALIQDWDDQFKSKTLNDLVNQFCSIMSNQGWGIFIPKQISDNLIVIELQNNISNIFNNKSKYICYYITGILAGFGEYALYKVNVIENNCNIEDPSRNSCEFRIEKIF
jgi:predicted hydrocarbon binding protein